MTGIPLSPQRRMLVLRLLVIGTALAIWLATLISRRALDTLFITLFNTPVILLLLLAVLHGQEQIRQQMHETRNQLSEDLNEAIKALSVGQEHYFLEYATLLRTMMRPDLETTELFARYLSRYLLAIAFPDKYQMPKPYNQYAEDIRDFHDAAAKAPHADGS